MKMRLDLRKRGSRLWESNPRPTHYEGRPHHPLPLLPATLLLLGSLGAASASSLDASSRHISCHATSRPLVPASVRINTIASSPDGAWQLFWVLPSADAGSCASQPASSRSSASGRVGRR